MRKRIPPNAPFILDRQLGDEQTLGIEWIDGKPIFRKVVQFAGGNNSSSSPADPDLNLTTGLDSALRATVALDGGATSKIFGLGDLVLSPTGQFVLTHIGTDYTGTTITVIIEYTKL